MKTPKITLFKMLLLLTVGCFTVFALASAQPKSEANSKIEDHATAPSLVIPFNFSTSQIDNRTVCSGNPSEHCYNTKLMIPMAMDLSKVAAKYPNDTATLSYTFLVKVKGEDTLNYPKALNPIYCENNGPSETGVSTTISNAKNNQSGSETTFSLEFEVDFVLDPKKTRMEGGLCIVVETMDPISKVHPPSPKEEKSVLEVKGLPFKPTWSDTVSIPKFDCYPCQLPPTKDK